MNIFAPQLKEVFDSLQCGFALLEPLKTGSDKTTGFLLKYYNKRFIADLELSGEELIGKELSLVLNNSDRLLQSCLRVYENAKSESIIVPVGRQTIKIFQIAISRVENIISISLNDLTQAKKEEWIIKENPFDKISNQDSSIRKTLDNMAEGCAILDFDWTFLYVNEANARHSRLKVNEMLGKKIFDVLPGLEKSEFYGKLKRCMEYRELQHIEAEYNFPDGESGWYEGIIQPVPDGIFILSIDITDRKLAEKKQNKAANLYQTLFNAIDQGFCIIEVLFNENGEAIDYIMEEVNSAFEKQIGLKNAKGKRMRELTPDHESYWYELFGSVVKTGKPARYQNWAEQLKRWYEVYAFPLELSGESKVGVLFNDITAHKHAEEILIENQKLLQSTLDNFPTAIVYKDLKGHYINFNKVIENVLGKRKEEIIGRTDYDFFPQHISEKYQKNDLMVIQTGNPMQREEVTMLPDGTYHHLVFSFPLKDSQGETYGVGHITYDITEIKRINEELTKKQEILDLILEHINEGIIVANAPDGKIIAVSSWGLNHTRAKSVEALIELPVENYLEQWDMRDIKTGERVEPGRLPLSRAVKGEIIQGEEWLLMLPDGTSLIISVNAVPIYNNTGDTVLSAVATWVDNTSRKKVEDKLRINEAAMQAFFDASPGLLNLIDRKLRFLKCDPITPTYFNLNGESIIGKSVDELNPDFAKDYLRPLMNKVIDSGKSETNVIIQGPVPSRGGEMGYWYTSYFPVPLSNIETGLGVIGIEITEMKRASEALVESEAKLLQAQKLGRFGNYSFDLKNNKIEWSDELYNIWEVDKNDPVPPFEILRNLIHPDDRSKVKKELDESAKDKIDMEFRIILSGHRIKYIRLITNVVFDETGNAIKRQGVVVDITDNKIAQLKLEEAYSEISDRLQEKEVLIRELYHRTKNNMQVISSLLGLNAMRYPHMDEVFNDLQNRIKAISLVHEKLYQSQNLSRINLKEYISELIKFLRISHSVTEEKVKYKCELEDVYVLLDTAVPCGLVITELIINSMKYAFPGDRTGHIEIKLNVLPGNLIRLVIADNGVGFDQEVKDHEKKLGLKLFKSIVENQLDGRVILNTEKGVSWTVEFKDALYYERVKN